jgi:hypothetical protein
MSENNLETPLNVNWKLYRIYNKDLSEFNDELLIEHYIKYGRHENRRCTHELPEGFEPDNYRTMNDDLKKLTDEELMIHYTLTGKAEQRTYLLSGKSNVKVSLRTVENIRKNGISYVVV